MIQRLFTLSLFALLGTQGAFAAWLSFGTATFSGGAGGTTIADPDSGTGQPVETVSSPITVSGINPATFSGTNFRVRLYGLTHPWAGDLVVIVRQIGTGVSATLFSQIGATAPGDAGYPADFLTAFGGFYDFYPGAANSLWAVASGLGDTDFIPDAVPGIPPTPISYYPTNGGSASNNNFATLNLIDPNGQWELVIIDMAAGPDNGGIPDLGSVVAWELQILDPVPEPSTFACMAAALGALAYRWRRATLR